MSEILFSVKSLFVEREESWPVTEPNSANFKNEISFLSFEMWNS
jgi:hypothetical protein